MTYWNIPVPKQLNEAVEEAVIKDFHATKADFVRDAVRQKLYKMGYKNEPFAKDRSMHDSREAL